MHQESRCRLFRCHAVFRNRSERQRGLRPAKKRPPERGFSQHQVSVRREALHVRASRFELIRIMQTFVHIGPEGEAFHEAPDNFCSCDHRSISRRRRHAAVSFDRAVCRNRCYAGAFPFGLFNQNRPSLNKYSPFNRSVIISEKRCRSALFGTGPASTPMSA